MDTWNLKRNIVRSLIMARTNTYAMFYRKRCIPQRQHKLDIN